MSGIERIAAERKRQVEKKGYHELHDDDHEGSEMAFAGVAYALMACGMPHELYWPAF